MGGEPGVVELGELVLVEGGGGVVSDVEDVFVVDFDDGELGVVGPAEVGVGVEVGEELGGVFALELDLAGVVEGGDFGAAGEEGGVVDAVGGGELTADEEVEVGVDASLF
jgi:hypothetical protein